MKKKERDLEKKVGKSRNCVEESVRGERRW